MRIVIYGTGAVGGYFGGRVAAVSGSDAVDVAFVARGTTLDTLRSLGLKITSPLGDLHLSNIEADDDPARLAPADVVILAVKAWQVPEAAASLAKLLGPEGFVLPLENGVDAPDQLAAVLGRERVVGGLCKILAQVDKPGHIRHLGAVPVVALGELDDHRSERIVRLHQALQSAGIQAHIPTSIRAAMWEKLLLISATSSLGAVCRMPIGVLRSTAETRDLLVRAMSEIRDVALAQEIPISPDIVERTMDFVDGLPESATTSMQRDVMAGRPSELESQTGAVVRHGKRVGMATPVHELLYHVLLPQEQAARSWVVGQFETGRMVVWHERSDHHEST